MNSKMGLKHSHFLEKNLTSQMSDIPSKKISKKTLKKYDFSGILKVFAGILKENENCRFLRGDVKFI